jgi:DNA polymerase/3'-5' exonuclease PolX
VIRPIPIRASPAPSPVSLPLSKEELDSYKETLKDPMTSIEPTPELTAQIQAEIDFRNMIYPEIINLRRHMTSQISPNKRLTRVFEQLVKYYEKKKASQSSAKEKEGTSFKIRSFKKAIDTIETHPRPIQTQEEALALPGIGKGLAARIQEILDTGTLAELNIPIDQTLVGELSEIHGIGPVKAQQLIDRFQVTSLADLKDKVDRGVIQVATHQLTRANLVALRYHSDLQQRIPFQEIQALIPHLQTAIHEVDPELRMMVCGSHRRLRPTSGDIDILLVHPGYQTKDEVSASQLLPRIIQLLMDRHIIIDHLTQEGATKYNGICRVPGKSGLGRRLDLLFIPRESFPAALMYFTGSGLFNQVFRHLANERGYTLNEYGLYRFINKEKGALIPVHTEQDLFRVVGVEYLEPEDREF